MHILSEVATLAPKLIIFDKDGTLIDFHTMWTSWITELARQLELATGQSIASQLFETMGFDPNTGHIIPEGHLAVTPMTGLKTLTAETLYMCGLSAPAVETAMATTWHIPDPVALAHPLTDLPILFNTLRDHGAKIAIATSDDRTPTKTLLTALKLTPFIDAIICADDGLPIKPAPDMILTICHQLDISPTTTIMIGDNVADLQMGCAAKVGLNIGVLSGLCSAEDLTDYADILLSSVDELIQK